MLPTFDELTLDALDTTTLDVLAVTATGRTDFVFEVSASPFMFIKKPEGGDPELEAFVMRTATDFESDSLTAVGDYVGYNYDTLKTLTLPVATSIGGRAFYGCTSLTAVDLPVATSIGADAFRGCTSLTTVDLPVATSIGMYAFYGCGASTANLPVATSIEYCTFYKCTSLTTVDLPVAARIGYAAFLGCTALTTVNLGSAGNAVTSVYANAFDSCTQSNLVINIYTATGAALSNSPFGATNATINYYQA